MALVPIFPAWPALLHFQALFALCKTPAYPTLTCKVSQFPPAPHSSRPSSNHQSACVNPAKVEQTQLSTLALAFAIDSGLPFAATNPSLDGGSYVTN